MWFQGDTFNVVQHEALCDKPLIEALEKIDKPLLVYAADSNVRAPLELCYVKPQPKTTAKMCPDAAKAAEAGHCVDGCAGMVQRWTSRLWHASLTKQIRPPPAS